MTRPPASVPTLTEVIELAGEPLQGDMALPYAETLPLEAMPQAEVLARLEPVLETWIGERVRAGVGGLQAQWAQELSTVLMRELRAALPQLLEQAMRQGGGGQRSR